MWEGQLSTRSATAHRSHTLKFQAFPPGTGGRFEPSSRWGGEHSSDGRGRDSVLGVSQPEAGQAGARRPREEPGLRLCEWRQLPHELLSPEGLSLSAWSLPLCKVPKVGTSAHLYQGGSWCSEPGVHVPQVSQQSGPVPRVSGASGRAASGVLQHVLCGVVLQVTQSETIPLPSP